MADSKVTDLAALSAANIAAGDLLEIVDVSDTSMAASGTNKKVTASDLRRVGDLVDWQIVVKGSDETVNNSAALQDDNDLLFPVAANESWVFEFLFFTTAASNTPDLRVALTFPAGATVLAEVVGPTNGITTVPGELRIFTPITTSGTAVTGIGSISTATPVRIKGVIRNGANAGSVTLQWAQNSADASDTKVKADSTVIARRYA